MTGGHSAAGGHLYVAGDTVVHRLPAASKLIGLVVFATAVAVTPRRAVPAFAVDVVVVLAIVGVARLRVGLVLRRLSVIAPFLVAAAVVPFVADGGDTVDLAGLSMSVEGCWAAWNIAIKAVLGATASIVLAATTPVPELLTGLARLRVPPVLVAIVAFMIRYLDIVTDQLRRMRQAMVARCHDPRWLWQVRPIASSAGALFVRSYERGERVHQAMLARGFDGTMPPLGPATLTTRWQRLVPLAPGAIAVAAVVTTVVVR